MTLKDFIKKLGCDKSATLLGVEKRTINSWIWGERRPRHKKALEIVGKTDGLVSYSECYGQAAEPDARSGATTGAG